MKRTNIITEIYFTDYAISGIQKDEPAYCIQCLYTSKNIPVTLVVVIGNSGLNTIRDIVQDSGINTAILNIKSERTAFKIIAEIKIANPAVIWTGQKTKIR